MSSSGVLFSDSNFTASLVVIKKTEVMNSEIFTIKFGKYRLGYCQIDFWQIFNGVPKLFKST